MMQIFLRGRIIICIGLALDVVLLLHLEIITEKLEREFDVNLLTTPGVVYKIKLNNGKVIDLQIHQIFQILLDSVN